jgi:quinol-cytochrome oxidoreductase complex cytochrome b subunit
VFSVLKETFRAEWERTVPAHINLLHYLGAVALVFFFLEITTGILLMIYYRPSAGEAYYSVGIIMDEVRLGWLIRSVHRWGSDLLILLSFLHLIRVYFSRAYQAPRQLNWTVGIVLLIVVGAFGFTGTLLTWDQYAYWSTDSARQIISGVSVLGNVLLSLIWGGWEIGEEVLLRFYAFHVGVLPWAVVLLLFLHVLLVWRFGIREPAQFRRGPRLPPVPFFPDFVINLLIAVLLIGGLLLSVAVFFPPPLLEQADPLSPFSGTRPRWYLLPVRELIESLSGGAAAVSIVVLLGLLFLVPVVDRRPDQPIWKTVLQRTIACLVIAVWVLLGVRGYLR